MDGEMLGRFGRRRGDLAWRGRRQPQCTDQRRMHGARAGRTSWGSGRGPSPPRAHSFLYSSVPRVLDIACLRVMCVLSMWHLLCARWMHTPLAEGQIFAALGALAAARWAPCERLFFWLDCDEPGEWRRLAVLFVSEIPTPRLYTKSVLACRPYVPCWGFGKYYYYYYYCDEPRDGPFFPSTPRRRVGGFKP